MYLDKDSIFNNLEKIFLFGEIDENFSENNLFERNKESYNKSTKTIFNILVTGESGCGKTTFIKCFLNKLKKNFQYNDNFINFKEKNKNEENNYNNHYLNGFYFSSFMGSSKNNSEEANNYNNFYTEDENENESSTVDFEIYILHFPKKNYIIRFIDSPGYNTTNSPQSWLEKIENYIQKQMTDYFNKRNSDDSNFKDDFLGLKYQDQSIDCRIHLCLYFLLNSKSSHFDFMSMKRLCEIVNLIPIIGKVNIIVIINFKGRLFDNQ